MTDDSGLAFDHVTLVLQKWQADVHLDVARDLSPADAELIMASAVVLWRASNGLPATITPPHIVEFRRMNSLHVLSRGGSEPWQPGRDLPEDTQRVFVVVYPTGNPMVEYVRPSREARAGIAEYRRGVQ